MFEFKLADEIADTEVDNSPSEEEPTQSVDAVNNLGDILFLIQVDKLEAEEVWEFDLVKISEEDGNIVRVAVLEPWMMEDSASAVGVESLDDLCKSDSIS